jgi:predicted dehydrogenase
MNIAIIGCGFVADYYMTTLANHAGLVLSGVFDSNAERLSAFARFHGVRAYADVAELLSDPAIGLVLNLTPPEAHFAVSKAALLAGKHVYSEKPLALTYDDAAQLVALAKERRLTLGAAPATVLGDAAQACRKAIKEGRLGTVRLAYAAMEDGQVFRERWQDWRSRSGAAWPGAHEFEIGCALEHAGYYLTWLCALFGPVRAIHPFGVCLFSDKGTGKASRLASDYQSAHLVFESGVIARITCGLAAERDRSLQIIGDEGSLLIEDGWNNRSRILLKARKPAAEALSGKILRKARSSLHALLRQPFSGGVRLHLPGKAALTPDFPSQIDFMRGVADQIRAIKAGESPQTGGAFALHITELALAMQNAGTENGPITLRSRFDPLP